jgi:hypothetical protein
VCRAVPYLPHNLPSFFLPSFLPFPFSLHVPSFPHASLPGKVSKHQPPFQPHHTDPDPDPDLDPSRTDPNCVELTSPHLIPFSSIPSSYTFTLPHSLTHLLSLRLLPYYPFQFHPLHLSPILLTFLHLSPPPPLPPHHPSLPPDVTYLPTYFTSIHPPSPIPVPIHPPFNPPSSPELPPPCLLGWQ